MDIFKTTYLTIRVGFPEPLAIGTMFPRCLRSSKSSQTIENGYSHPKVYLDDTIAVVSELACRTGLHPFETMAHTRNLFRWSLNSQINNTDAADHLQECLLFRSISLRLEAPAFVEVDMDYGRKSWRADA